MTEPLTCVFAEFHAGITSLQGNPAPTPPIPTSSTLEFHRGTDPWPAETSPGGAEFHGIQSQHDRHASDLRVSRSLRLRRRVRARDERGTLRLERPAPTARNGVSELGGSEFWNPAVAPRLSVGWKAIRAHLVEHEKAGWVTLKEAARKNSDLQGESCRNLVREAVKAGLIVKNGRSYRLTEKGAAAGGPGLDGAVGDR